MNALFSPPSLPPPTPSAPSLCSGRLAAVALERGLVMKHAMWQLHILRMYCSTVVFDGTTLLSDGYDNRVGVVCFGANVERG